MINFKERLLSQCKSKRFKKNQQELRCELLNRTEFLDVVYGDAVHMRTRFFVVENDITNKNLIPLCHCGKRVTLQNGYFTKTCGDDGCVRDLLDNNIKHTKEKIEKAKKKRKETNIKRYGVEHSASAQKVREKIKSTNSTRYGSECVLSVDSIRQKIEKTNHTLFGGHPMKNVGVKEKVKATNLDRYGSECVFGSDDVKDKIATTVRERYGVDTISQHRKIRDKIRETNLERYGVENFFQSNQFKEQNRQNTFELYGVPNLSQKHFSEELWGLLNSKDKLEKLYADKGVKTISGVYGLDQSTVYDWLNYHNVQLTPQKSSPEKEITNFIVDELGLSVIENSRTEIHPYELDIYIPSHNLAIEFNGLFWHSTKFKSRNYHKMKQDVCEEKGIRLLQVFEDEWNDKKEIVKSLIKHKLGVTDPSRKVYARKCDINNELTRESIKHFYDSHHIQGHRQCKINYGLEYEDRLVAIMSFTKNKNNTYELVRFATSCHVIGGFSRLLKRFLRENEYCSKVVSFADRRWSDGGVYEKNGFELDYITKPSYWYKPKGQCVRLNKRRFRRCKLQYLLDDYDPNQSETENMLKNGYDMIYDAGLMKYTLRKG